MKPWKTILVPTDFSDTSLLALPYAVALGKRDDATILIAHVAPRDASLDTVIERLDGIGCTLPTARHRELVAVAGQPVERLVDVAKDNQADLVVITTHGRTGLDSVLMGSTAAGLMREAPCPVLVLKTPQRDFVLRVHEEQLMATRAAGLEEGLLKAQWLKGKPPTEEDLYFARQDRLSIESALREKIRLEARTPAVKIDTIVVPTDFSPQSRSAVAYADRLAGEFGARIVLMHSLESPRQWALKRIRAAEVALLEIVETLPAGRAHGCVNFGDPVSATITMARDQRAELIVMGTHGRKGLTRMLLGSTAEGVVRHSPCPVLTVKQPLTAIPAAGSEAALAAAR